MSQRIVLFAVLSVCLCRTAEGQNVFRDFGSNAPATYAPSDPFTRGAVFRNYMGHGGLYYNCDGQEQKRWSPYICWFGPTPECLCIEDLVSDWRCQCAEVRQRIRWGRGCDVIHDTVPYLPSDCIRAGFGAGGCHLARKDETPPPPEERTAEVAEPERKGILR